MRTKLFVQSICRRILEYRCLYLLTLLYAVLPCSSFEKPLFDAVLYYFLCVDWVSQFQVLTNKISRIPLAFYIYGTLAFIYGKLTFIYRKLA